MTRENARTFPDVFDVCLVESADEDTEGPVFLDSMDTGLSWGGTHTLTSR